jgi:RNA polymerase sigma factor (sigma-70 family)
MNDSELLQRYADTGSETAFTELVNRHLNLVYSAAIRQVGGDAHLAQDVAQTVFIDLARKASTVTRGSVLIGWLYTSTRYAAAKIVRAEQRRHAREQEAYAMQELTDTPASEPQWEQLRLLLDEAMHELKEPDRNAVLLRYFEGRQLTEVGARLGLSEDAARMRVGRALEKLRGLLAKRGAVSTVAALAALLSSQAVTAAPAGLAINIAGTALASAAGSTGTTLAILKLLTMTKVKFAIIAALIVAGAAAPLIVAHQTQVAALREENHSLKQQQEDLTQQMAPLSAENVRLSNLLANAKASSMAQSYHSNELLRLRGEVARLRQGLRDSNQTKTSGTGSSEDPGMEAALKTWAARVALLKQRLEQMPDKRIPELQLVADKDWFDAVKSVKKLETEDDYRQALDDLRRNVKSEFAHMLQVALRGYAKANADQLPTDLSQLKPYFDKPVDDAVLARYTLLQTGKVSEASDYLVAETAPPVDDEFDTVYKISINGVNSSSVNRSEEAIKQAGILYAQAHNDLLPTEPSQLTPFLKEPIDPAKIQKVLNKVPPGVTTMEQLKPLLK